MLPKEKSFKITVALIQEVSLEVIHNDETFEIELNGEKISIINNGDNSWSLVSGDLLQEVVNLLGEAIEKHYKEGS
jgi:hypothetical protein